MKACKKLVKDWKMATVWGVLLWVLIFVAVSIMMFGCPDFYQSWMTLIVYPFLIVFCARMYFKGAKGNVKDGIVLGIYWVALGTILDLVVTIPLFVKSYAFLGQTTLWLGWAETIVFPALTAKHWSK